METGDKQIATTIQSINTAPNRIQNPAYVRALAGTATWLTEAGAATIE
jgi:hypothetical protein